MPRFQNKSDRDEDGGGDDQTDEPETADADAGIDTVDASTPGKHKGVEEAHLQTTAPRTEQGYLPSLLLPALRPTRKITLVQRDDGYERRRVWRCGRCGLGIGYEVENADSAKVKDGGEEEEERMRVMFVLEDSLMRTESMLGPIAQAGDGKELSGS